MNEHRLASNNNFTVESFKPPFSAFSHVETNFPDNDSIKRLFSLARSGEAKTLVTEDIPPRGIILEENEEIRDYFPNFREGDLKRISFWKTDFNKDSVTENTIDDTACIGYAVLKNDTVPNLFGNRWHVFEAVFKKYDHEHNYIPRPKTYRVNLLDREISIDGLLFAQQNGLNKRCAHVALQSLLSRIIDDDISYRRINEICQNPPPTGPNFIKGLSANQIQKVLRAYKIPFRDHDYQGSTSKDRNRYAYQKYVYSGIESGYGALVGFQLTRSNIPQPLRHIIPFYGHTFNKDTWAPAADKSYFKVGEKLKYVPSEYWTSSFLGHDDNFGPNYCVPRLYINPKQVVYVVELLKPGIKFNGSQAEVLALRFLDSVLKQINSQANVWLQRLIESAREGKIVLRAVATDRAGYIKHLGEKTDWSGNNERKDIINVLKKYLPNRLWIVEVSIPELFPANERKIGDIVLNGAIPISTRDRSNFMLVRLPSIYLFNLSFKNKKRFISFPSNLISHVDLLTLE